MARISDILLRCPKDGRLVKLLDQVNNSMYGGVSSSIRSGKKSQVKTTSKTSKEMGCLDQTIIKYNQNKPICNCDCHPKRNNWMRQ